MGSAAEAPVTRPRALVVESHEELRRAVVNILTRNGYEVVPAATFEEAMALAQGRPFQWLYSAPALRIPDVPWSCTSTLDGVRVEDQGDGTARIQISRVVPWRRVVQLLNALTEED